MRDDDTGEEIRCSYCSSADDCEHLLAVIDRTFLECSAGYASARFLEFSETIDAEFLERLNRGWSGRGKWSERPLADLWKHASEEWVAGKDVSLDPYILFALLVDLLEAAGGERYAGPVHDGEAPGFSSAITLLYAKQPRAVFDSALLNLKERLSQASG
jgi:hypothetical protein